ncbi:substrate-binding domain-containing protein [Streptomyces sp. NPDC048484]|uniref:substrate-binding domain-containing protein n=1 Tax=Streptomyces sp. NPDC048484 TaxID=3155146 RepID=UPI00343512E9
MNRATRRTALAATAASLALTLAACGSGDGGAEASPTKGDDITVGLLLPEKANSRYEKFDYPIIKKKVGTLTDGKGKVVYANAGQNAAVQNRQLDQMVDDKVDVLLVDAVDSHAIAAGVKKAKAAGVPVIAYDRLAEGPIDAYISFDNEEVGQMQGRALADRLDGGRSQKIVMMNGAVTDPNAAQFKAAALGELKGKVTIAKTYDTADWKPANARANMVEAISSIGVDNIAGVYSANDGMAGGVISALKAAGVTKLPPVTGQDAELDAVRRILLGDQFMSVYKPYPEEAETAAEVAVARVRGYGIEFDSLTPDRVSSPTDKSIPASLVQVSALTRKTIESTVIQDGIYTADEICTAKYQAECDSLGIK